MAPDVLLDHWEMQSEFGRIANSIYDMDRIEKYSDGLIGLGVRSIGTYS